MRSVCAGCQRWFVGEAYNFLVVDDNPDGRALLVRTLRRKYPTSVIVEAGDGRLAVEFARTRTWHVIVAHRAGEMDAVSLIRELRAAAPNTAILGVSGIDRATAMKTAGADAFLNYDAWLLLGIVIEQLVARDGGNEPTTRD